MNKKRILLFTCEYPPTLGGAGSVAEDIVKVLKEDYNLSLLTTKVNESRVIDSCVNIYEFSLLNYNYLYSFYRYIVRNNIDFEQYDRIILGDFGSTIISSFFFNENLQRKCLLYLHGSEPEIVYQNMGKKMKLLGFKKKYEKLLGNCKTIIAVSNFMKKKFLSISQLYNLDFKMKVIYNGIDSELFHYCVDNNILSLYKKEKNTKILLSVSRIDKKKGYTRMLELFKKLNPLDNQIKWIIIGEGNFEQELISKINEENLSDSIFLIGKVSRENLKYYYSNCDCFWLLSEYKESFGLVYVEANFCGCPVIANSGSGVNECIEHGINGYLVNSDNQCISSILEILNNKKNKDEILDFSSRFSLNQFKKALINIIEL